MTRKYLLNRCLQFRLAGLLGWLIVSIFTAKTQAQQSNIVPDNTLGAESSQVIGNFQGQPREVITGGVTRQINLFHSFGEFNISEGRGAYFLSPSADIQNILARVTGNNPSEILGRLGTFGSSNPNLFLINPNRIVLGKDASLDVQGSFVGTTANGIQFGNQGVFSAINPEAVPLLTIDPSALLFNQINQNAAIASQSRLENGGGLFASPGKSLLLVGGNVILDGRQMGVIGGSIEIGSVSGSGSVELISNRNGLQLGFSDAVPRSDVVLQNNAQIFAIADGDFGDGNIAIYARNLDVRGDSLIRGGILTGLRTKAETQAGDIILNATGTVRKFSVDIDVTAITTFFINTRVARDLTTTA